MKKRKVNALVLLALFSPMMVLADHTTQDTLDTTTDLYSLTPLIVTADRREQEAFDVPTSIQSFDRETIVHGLYENTDELIRAVPNAHISQQRAGTGETNFSIRGVGTTTVNVDQTIGFYVDNVPVTSVSEFGLEYFDIDSIEVLRGPQGTLYGRNALGGVIHIKTAQPEHEQKAKLTTSYGSDNEKRFSVMANTPISDKVLGRFNFLHASRDERIRSSVDGLDDIDDLHLNAARAKILFLPNDRLRLLVSADILDSKQSTGTGDFLTATEQGVNTLRPAVIEKKNNGISLEGQYQFENMKLVSLTSLRHHDQLGQGSRPETENYNPQIAPTAVFNNDFTAALDQTTITQEFRLESTDDQPLSWIAGIFLQRNDADRISDIINLPTNLYERSFADTKDRSIALFTDATYEVDTKFSITAGIRASWDKKELDYRHEGSFLPVIGFSFAPNQTLKQTQSFNDVSPRLVFEYKLTPDINIYTKASRGYKTGGFNTEFVALGTSSYDKESIWSYEAGIKSRLLDGRLEMDLNIFHMDWSDQQVLIFANGISQVSNVEKSESKGMEFQVRARPIENLFLSASLGYVDAKFTDTPSSLNVDGNQQPNTPDWSASITGQIEQQLFTNTLGFIRVDVSYLSSFYWDVQNTLEEPNHTFVNLSTGIETDDYELTIFAKNLSDEEYRVFALSGTPGFFGDLAQPGHGREIGIRASLKF